MVGYYAEQIKTVSDTLDAIRSYRNQRIYDEQKAG